MIHRHLLPSTQALTLSRLSPTCSTVHVKSWPGATPDQCPSDAGTPSPIGTGKTSAAGHGGGGLCNYLLCNYFITDFQHTPRHIGTWSMCMEGVEGGASTPPSLVLPPQSRRVTEREGWLLAVAALFLNNTVVSILIFAVL